MNAAIYARVSTEEQDTLDSQVRVCQEYADRKGLNVVAVYKDKYSGVTLFRPAFLELQEALFKGVIEAVIMLTSDRLARKTTAALSLYEEWADAGVALHYTDRGLVDYDSIMVEGVMFLTNEEEKRRIRKRTMNGRIEKAQGDPSKNIPGRPVLNGYPAYGYRKIGRLKEAYLVIEDDEAEVVRQVYDWFTRDFLSYREIARRLNRAGVPRQTKNGCTHWSNTSIYRILTHEMYAGTDYYRKTKTRIQHSIGPNGEAIKKKISTKRPKSEWIAIDVPHLAIIDRATFEAAAKRIERNKLKARRNKKRNYFMSGHYRCTCGQVMVGHHRQGYLHYRCHTHWRKPGQEACPVSNRSVVCHRVDERMWGWVEALLSDEDELRASLKELIDNREDALQHTRRQWEATCRLLDKKQAALDRLVDEMAYDYDAVVMDTFRERVSTLSQQIGELDQQQKQLEAEIASTEVGPELVDEILQAAEIYRERLPDASYGDRRRIMELLEVQAVFRWDGSPWMEVECIFPGVADAIDLRHSARISRRAKPT